MSGFLGFWFSLVGSIIGGFVILSDRSGFLAELIEFGFSLFLFVLIGVEAFFGSIGVFGVEFLGLFEDGDTAFFEGILSSIENSKVVARRGIEPLSKV